MTHAEHTPTNAAEVATDDRQLLIGRVLHPAGFFAASRVVDRSTGSDSTGPVSGGTVFLVPEEVHGVRVNDSFMFSGGGSQSPVSGSTAFIKQEGAPAAPDQLTVAEDIGAIAVEQIEN